MKENLTIQNWNFIRNWWKERKRLYVYTSSSYFANICESDEETHEIKRVINGNGGKKLILIEDVFLYPEIPRINICLKEYNDGKK